MISFKNSCDGFYESLDVRFTKYCDNNCAFCIEKKGLDALCNKPDVNKMINHTLSSDIRSILIVGGEPMLFPDELAEYIKGIRYHVDTIYITTSLPNVFDTHKESCKYILEHVDGFNVSIQDTDYERNNEILQASSKHNRLDILNYLLKNYSNKIRVNLNLSKGGIDNWIKLYKNISELYMIGCEHVKINELQESDKYVSFEEITKDRIKIDQKLKSPYSHGCQNEITSECFPKGMKITLKRSCFFTEKSRNASFADLIKVISKNVNPRKRKPFGVMYENGEMSKGWKIK